MPLLFSDHLVKRDSDGLGALAPPPLLPRGEEERTTTRGMGVFDLGELNMKLGGYIKGKVPPFFHHGELLIFYLITLK